MSTTPVLTVIGATGLQGGSVIKAVQAIPALSHFKLRALTRDPSKPAAAALAAQGIDVRAADLGEPATLAPALAGTHTLFAVTNFWERGFAPADPAAEAAREEQQGRAIADAAVAAGVQHLIFSSLDDPAALTGGKLNHILHFAAKARAQAYMEERKRGSGMAASYVLPGFYMSNFATMAQTGPDGKIAISLPWHPTETQVALFDAAKDTGVYAAAFMLQGPAAADGKAVRALSEWLTPTQIADEYGKAKGAPAAFNALPEGVMRQFLPPTIAEEMEENMLLVRDYSYYGVKGREAEVLAEARDFVKPTGLALTSFAEFLARKE